jgi:Zn-dependent M28 family amino/carboxypeptidase
MPNWITRSYEESVGYDLLADLVDSGHRLGGSESERVAAELTREALADVGARNARLDEFELTGWQRGSSHLVLGDHGTRIETFALPKSPSMTKKGEFIDLGDGLPRDFENHDVSGKVVMVSSGVPDSHPRYVHRREKYDMAVEQGAVGFVYRNHQSGCLPRSGSVSSKDGPIGSIPAVGISKEDGLRVTRLAGGEEVTLSVDANIGPTTSQNVHAELGPETDERVLVTAHVDGHDVSESAADNGGGVATVVEIVANLAPREDELDTQIQFSVYGAEEFGLLGSAYDAETTNTDTIKAVLNHDVMGLTRNLRFNTNGFDVLEYLARQVCTEFQHPLSVNRQLALSSDHWRYVERGVPGIFVANRFKDSGGRGFILTPEDTLDKIDPRNLRDSGLLLTEYACRMADDQFQVEHVDRDVIQKTLEKEDQTYKAQQYSQAAKHR